MRRMLTAKLQNRSGDLKRITEDVPMFIEIDISRKEHVLPMVPAGKSNHEMLGVKFNA